MRDIIFSSYHRKLLSLVLCIGLIPLVAASVILYNDKIENETNSLKNKLSTSSEVGADNISRWITTQKENINAISEDEIIISSTKELSKQNTNQIENFENRFKLERKLGTYIENFPDFQSFFISDLKSKEVIFYTDLLPPVEQYTNNNLINNPIEEFFISEIVFSPKTIKNEFNKYEKNIPTFFMSTPIEGEEGIEGILTARMDFFKINALIEKNNELFFGNSYLIDVEGNILNIQSLSTESKNTFQKIIEPDSEKFTKIFQMKEKESTKQNLEGYTNHNGNVVVGSISPVKGTDWSFIVEIEQKKAFSEITFVQTLIISTISIVIIAIIGTSFYFASDLTNPINQLQKAAEQVTKGNLDTKISIKSKDEIGKLADSFQQMLHNLKKMTDIEAQMALQQNLRKALDESSIVSVLDKNGNIIHVNDKFCEVSKYSRNELIGIDQKILRSGIHPPEFYKELWEKISNGQVWKGEVCNKAKDGVFFWNKVTILPFVDKEGNISEYVAVRHDITEEKNLAQKIIQTERLSAIGELSARMSHDIRNPLSILNNEINILKSKNLLKDDQTRRIDRSMKRITHQIDDVLEFLRETPLNYSKFELLELIQQVITNLNVPHEIKIDVVGKEIFMTGDQQKIEIVLVNLIFNSIQAVEEKGNIEIKIWETETENMIQVTDSGKGIQITPIEKIFEPLVTSKQKGTGLGLASVKNIITQHKGTVTVKNNPTTFLVTIPKKEEKID